MVGFQDFKDADACICRKMFIFPTHAHGYPEIESRYIHFRAERELKLEISYLILIILIIFGV